MNPNEPCRSVVTYHVFLEEVIRKRAKNVVMSFYNSFERIPD
jgi:hypothetical protein